MLTILFCFSSCDDFEVSDNSFTFNVFYKQANFICYEIYPQYNGIEYTTFVATLDALERLHTHGLIDSIYTELTDDKLYTKSTRQVVTDLQSDTEYFMCSFYMDSKHRPIYSLVKKAFHTPAVEEVNMSFEWNCADKIVTIKPSDGHTYYWTFFMKKDVDMEYEANPSYAFYSELAYYETYGMTQYVVSSMDDEGLITDQCPSVVEGDTLYFVASPYNLRTGYCPVPEVWYGIYDPMQFDILPVSAMDSIN